MIRLGLRQLRRGAYQSHQITATIKPAIGVVSYQQTRSFARNRNKDSSSSSSRPTKVAEVEDETSSNPLVRAPPPKADPWQAVTDKATGQVYWWNQDTNETTSLGAPKPGSDEENAALVAQRQAQELAYAQQQQPQQPGLGRAVAEGFSFGAGMAVARTMVGSLFGLGGGGGDDGGDWL